ncbi:MAG: DUF885 domain-containing protein [Clostridiales bacterium]|nr:DUF885 domain-containing protein [Clostridiales bacterium]
MIKCLKRIIPFALAAAMALSMQSTALSQSRALPSGSSPLSSVSAASAETARKSFEELCNEFFAHEASADTITLNFIVANPENYGLAVPPPTLGDFTADSLSERISYFKDAGDRLKDINPSLLTAAQKTTYEILAKTLEAEEKFKDYLYYIEPLSPALGIQAQLPILLGEFSFRKASDLNDYILLLGQTPKLFSQLADFEAEKKALGLFMSKYNAQSVISQCEDFALDPANNFLISHFNKIADEFPGLSAQERDALKQRSRDAVISQLIPAYRDLASAIRALNVGNENQGGMSTYKGGKEYYQLLVNSSTNSSRSVDEMERMMKESLDKARAFLAGKSSGDINELLPIAKSSPEEIIEFQRNAIASDFPSLDGINYKVEYVDKSMENYLSPAFYLTPALDDFKDNIIYINPRALSLTRDSWLFTTLGHEGYPGHLLQNVYFRQQKPAPIRSVIPFYGYVEGWGTYAEIYSYRLCADKDTSDILSSTAVYNFCLYGLADIGVNYSSWDLPKLRQFFAEQGIIDSTAVSSIYDMLSADPGNYLNYTIGYLEIIALKEKAEKALGSKFVLKDFHEFYLSAGPAWFDILDAKLDDWIDLKSGRQAARFSAIHLSSRTHAMLPA